MNLVVGAKGDEYPGWLSTDARSTAAPLDIRDARDWTRYVRPGSVERIVCEHVLEHMSEADALLALQNFRTALRPGGFARVAVPDAFYPNPSYHSFCAPGSVGQWFFASFIYGPDEPAHKVHYNYYTLTALIHRAGLTPRLLEWHDERGQFHRMPYDVMEAPIKRRAGSEYAVNFYRPMLGFDNISLIVDAVRGY